MPNVVMPNGDLVAFPDDMPKEQIRELISSKFPTEARQALADSGAKPFQGPVEGVATVVGNIPAEIAKTKYGLGQAVLETLHQEIDPYTTDGVLTPPIEQIVRPGAPIEDMLEAPAAVTKPALGLGQMLPDDVKRGIGRTLAKEELSQKLRYRAAEAGKGELDMRPGSPEYYAAGTAGALTEMAGPAILSMAMKNPAPLVTYFTTRSFGTQYGEAREKGASTQTAFVSAALYAAAEAATEALAGKVLIEGGKTLVGAVLKSSAAEGLTEAATEALQALVDVGVVREDMTLEDALSRVKDAGIIGALSGGAVAGATHPFRDKSSGEPAAVPEATEVDGAAPVDTAPTAALPPPSRQLALPSPEAYPAPDITRRQPTLDPEVAPAAAPPTPEAEMERIASEALKRTRQAETAALLQTARETVAPLGTFEATELPDAVALQVNRNRATRGRAVDAPITIEDMVRAKVPQAQIDAVIALRKPLTQGRVTEPQDIRIAAKAKNIRVDKSFEELARRTVGSSDLTTMSPTQLSVLRDVVEAMPAHEAPVSVPLADAAPFTDKQYLDAVEATRKQGRYTLGAIKSATGLKSDKDARAVRDAMVRRGQLVQRGANDYRLYDVLGEQQKATPQDLPDGAFREHVVRRMPVGMVALHKNGKIAGKFESDAAASDRVRKVRADEASAGAQPSTLEIKPAGRVAYGVVENRYDEEGNFLGQAVVDSYGDETAARAAAEKLNDPDTGAKARPVEAPVEKLPGGRFILRQDGQVVDKVINSPVELREELRARRQTRREMNLAPPVFEIQTAPDVTEAAPKLPRAEQAAPKTAKPAPPAGLAGRVNEVVARLEAIGNTRGLPLLGTRVRLADVVTSRRDNRPVEGVFRPGDNLIRLTTAHIKPDMSLDEVVDVLAGVMDHETIHALKAAGVLDPQSEAWKTLTKYAAKTKKPRDEKGRTYLKAAEDMYGGREGYGTPESIEEEAIAEVFRYWAADRRNVAGKPATALRQIVEWFRRLIRAVPEDILRQIETGELVRAKFPPPGGNSPRAKTTQAMNTAATTMATAQATQDPAAMQAARRQYVRARDQAREDRYGRTGGKTVVGVTPSLALQTGERDIDTAELMLENVRASGIGSKTRLRTYLPEPLDFLEKMARAQEKAKHEPNREAVSRAYFALGSELKAMVQALNLQIEPFRGPGEPYPSQAAMLEDTQMGTLQMKLSTDLFGTSPENANHPLYKPSGMTTADGTALTYNDLLRAVADVLGHGPTGLGYMPRDGYNAYHALRPLFSDIAVPALATETLLQDAWANYGAHLRRPDGTLPQPMDADFLPLNQRQYPEQKAFVLRLTELTTDPGVQAVEAAAVADDLGEDVRYSVGSPQFQSWFGDSVVRSPGGGPLRVFHATAYASFDEFDTKRSEMGTHFGTYRQAHAMGHELNRDKPRIQKTGIGVHMLPIYLSIQRPLRLRDESSFGNDYVAPQLAELGIIDARDADYLKQYGYQYRKQLQEAIKAAGYDGIVYLNRVEGVGDAGVGIPSSDIEQLTDEAYKEKYPTAEDSWIIFEPTQAKSAIGNIGTYDPNNPDIRYSVASPEFDAYLKRAYAELPPADLRPLPAIENGLTGPIPIAVLAARDYAKKAGLPVRRQSDYVRVDVPRARRIAQAYTDMPHAPQDPKVLGAYRAMAAETIAQYEAVRATGIGIDTILPGMDDPYPAGPRDVLRDIARGHIWYFPTDDGFGSSAAFDPSDNPLLTPTQFVSDNGKPMVVNDLFRVVHDFFGHGIEGTGFGPRGEENAWQSHMRLFSEAAVPAMTSETRGQNSWVNYGPYGDRNRADPRNTTYADQKTGVMPEWTWREGVVDDSRESRLDPTVPVELDDLARNPAVEVRGKIFEGMMHADATRRAVEEFGESVVDDEASFGYTDTTGLFHSFSNPPDAVKRFTEAFDAARAASEFGGMVHRYSDDDYADMTLYLSPDGMSGFAIKGSNDIVSVFSNPNGSRGRLPALMKQAVEAGGRKLDAFDAGLPQMYAKYGFVETSRMDWDDLYAPDGWDYAKFGRPDIVFMSYAGPEAQAEAGDTMRYSLGDRKLAEQTPGLKGSLRYLTEDERQRVTKRTAANFVNLFQNLPKAQEMAAVAFSGRAKRGWYKKSADALLDIFGAEDAPRFAALLAALSPQTSVESNTVNALNTWVEWDKAGRPVDQRGIMRVLSRSVQGNKGDGSILPAWINNTVRALASEDPGAIVLSGPKVNSFMLNLRHVTNEVTNDAWMANYANVNQELFRAARIPAPSSDPVGGQLGVKSPGYLAMSAVVRKAATIASDMTGDAWTPSEVQETVWSWAKTLYEKANIAATARDILAAGNLRHSEIGATPDFATLFIGGVYRNILERGGYANPVRALEGRGPAYDASAVGGEPLSAEGSGLAQGTYDAYLKRAAARLDARREAVGANYQEEAEAAYAAKFADPPERSPYMTDDDYDVRFSITSPLFDETFGARLPGGRLYGNNAIDAATVVSIPGTSPIALAAPVDGGQFFGGHLAEAQLRMAQDGIDGASMVYLRVEDFLKLAGKATHPEQAKIDAAIGEGYKLNALPSISFEGNDGVVDARVDGAYAARALNGRAKRLPVVLYPKGRQRFGALVGFRNRTANDTPAIPIAELPEPTEAQKAAGNYPKGSIRTGGLDISIENPAGSRRSGTDRKGNSWSVQMQDHYGYIRGTVGKDKDHLDVFVAPGTGQLADTAPVFVVDQVGTDGVFDEAKIMLGYPDQRTAEAAYKANYSRGWTGMGAVTPTTLGRLKEWIATGKTRGQFAKAGFAATPPVQEGVTIAMPNDGLQEFYPDRRGERMSVGSEAFNKWFGDSVVVDDTGKPMVAYHSSLVWTRDGVTLGDFDVFDRMASVSIVGREPSIDNVGLWFGTYANAAKDAHAYGGSGGVVYPVYLSIKNPWRPSSFQRFNEKMHETAGSEFVGAKAIPTGQPPGRGDAGLLRDWLAFHGYDGVVFPEGSVDMPGQTVWVALEPNQIKSAIGNRGTWSASEADIRYSVNSPVGTRVPQQIDADTYSVVHRATTSWLGKQMLKLGRSKTDIPVLGAATRLLFGGASPYELRVAQEDQYLSLLEMMERIKKEGGKVTDAQNAYVAQQAAGSKATHRIQQHQQELYDPLLAGIKARSKTFSLAEYEEFLYARHAPERNALLRARGSKEPNPSGMSEAEAAKVIEKFTREKKIDAMRELDPMLNALRDSITRTRVDGGLLAPDNVSTAYQYWVPMQNGEDFDPFDQVSRRSGFTGRGMSVAGKENRPTVGRGSKAGDLLSNMILQDTMAVVRSEHAAFNRKLVEVIQSNPDLARQDVEVLTKPPLKTVVGSDGRIRSIVDPNFRSAPGYYVTKIAGREVVLKIHNPWLERALKGEFVQQTGPILQLIGSITRTLAAMRTTYNPTFVVTNLARDLQAAALNLAPQDIKGLAGRMLAGVPASTKAVGAYLLSGDTSSERGRYYQEMLENGWTVSHMGLSTLETVVDRVRRDAHTATGWQMGPAAARKAVGNIFGAIESTLGVAENGVRLSAYVEARRAGASVAQAGYLAKNLTVNFNKRGERGSSMNMMYMFYNAGVQGGAVLANMAKSKRGQKYLAAIVMTGFVLDMINRMVSDDENEDGVPDYDQFTEHELQRNLIVPNPLALLGVPNNPRYLKFPMPLGYNAAHNLGRNTSNMFARKNKTWVDSLASIAGGTADALNPISGGGDFLNFVMPTFLDPLVDIAANKDYAGRDIVPERPNYGGPDEPMSQRYWSSTDKSFIEVSKFLNDVTGGNEVRPGAIDLSPEHLDYWTAFAAGGVGKFLLDMKYNITEGAPLALSGQFEDIDTSRLPLINVIVGSNIDRSAQAQYYELGKSVMTVEEEIKRFNELGQPLRAREVRQRYPVEAAAATLFSGADRQLAGLRKQLKLLADNTRMNEKSKTAQMKRLRDQMDELMARTLKQFYRMQDVSR